MADSNRTHARRGERLRAPCQLALLLLLGLWLGPACSRSGLEPFDVSPDDTEVEPRTVAGAGAAATLLDAGADAAPPDDRAPPVDAGPECAPEPETCNGLDDDCNGRVDDLDPVPCATGGFRYCIAGRESACPERCESCIPGSERICFISFCTFWGTQTCAADGRGFGICREEHAPSVCSGFTSDRRDLDRLERCCIDAGYCCVDAEDLDRDGNRNEMLGRCDEVMCR